MIESVRTWMCICVHAIRTTHVSRWLLATAGDPGLSTDDDQKSDTFTCSILNAHSPFSPCHTCSTNKPNTQTGIHTLLFQIQNQKKTTTLFFPGACCYPWLHMKDLYPFSKSHSSNLWNMYKLKLSEQKSFKCQQFVKKPKPLTVIQPNIFTSRIKNPQRTESKETLQFNKSQLLQKVFTFLSNYNSD